VLGDATRDENNRSGKSKVSVPITVRQLEALVRISEAMAKMQLSNVVTPEHVRKAVEIFTVRSKMKIPPPTCLIKSLCLFVKFAYAIVISGARAFQTRTRALKSQSPYNL
jgi:hypothetical protein